MLISNFPTFSYATWQGLIIILEDTPYVINDGNTNYKYVYWETENPYTLKATNDKLSTSLTRFLIYINQDGIASEVPQDVIGIQYREGTGVLVSKIAGQVSQLDGKYYAVKESIDGLEKIIGSSGESEDGSIVDRVNKLEQNAESTSETISEFVTTYYDDKETEELRSNITEALIAMGTALGEYQEIVASACEDFSITGEEKLEVQEAQNKFTENVNLAFDCHDELIARITTSENIERINVLNNARSNLQDAVDNLNTSVNTCLSDNTTVPSEITIMLNMFANIGVKANDYETALSDATVLGIGGEVVRNIFTTNKTATEFNQKLSNITEVIDPETGLPALIKQNETNINQTAEDIRLNYMKYDTVTSEITVADNVIKLDAGTVLMTGTLTWDTLDEDAKVNLKGEKGADGSAQYVMLTGDQLIKYDARGNPSRSSILITAMMSGISETSSILWKYKSEGSEEWNNITSNIFGTSYTLLENDVIWNNKDSITIRIIVDNTYYDDFTVVKVRDGIDGTLAEYVEINGDNIFKYTIKKGTTIFTPTPSSITLEGKAYNINTTNTRWYYRRPSETNWTLLSDYNGDFTIDILADDVELFPNDNDVVQIKFELNTYSDIMTITKVYDGQDSVMAILSNENHIIPCKSDGTPTTFVGATTDLSIYVGNINDTSNWTIYIDTINVTGNPSNNNRTFTVTDILDDVGYVDFVASKNDFDSVTKRFTITKSKNGLDGYIGEDSISYWIVSSASAIIKKEDGTYEPSTIEFNAKCKEGKKEVDDYEGIFKIYEEEGGNWVEKYASPSNENACSYIITSSNNIKIELYEDETFIDEEHIPVLTDGETTPIAFLDNDSHVIPCNFNGIPLNYEGATTTMYVYAGSVDDSDNWKFTIAETNLHGTITNNNRTYTVTGIDSNTAYIDITASKEGNDSITRRFTVSKAINGVDGESAKYVYITGDQVFKYSDDFSGTPIPSEITLGVTKYNITSVGKWQYKNGNTYVDMGVTSDKITITPSSGTFTTQNVSTFRYTVEDYYDEITIIKISDGSNGLPGSDGEDGIYILLTNENHTVPCDSEGNYLSEDLERARTEIHVYKGLEEVNFTNITLTSVGCNAIVDGTSVVLTSLEENSATVSIELTVEGKKFTKIMSISKALRGKAGQGMNILGALADVSNLPLEGSVNDAYIIGDDIYIWSSKENGWIIGATIDAIQGEKGADGQTTYFHIKYANNVTFDEDNVPINAEWTENNGEETGDWIGFYTDFYDAEPLIASYYKWKKIKGEQGENGIVVNLTNDSHVIPCNPDGTTDENSFIGCETKISLFLGAEEVDDGVSYSYTLSDSENMGVVFDSNTGTCEVKVMNNIDNGYVDLSAYYNGIKYTKRFTISKNKQGEDAITINLSNENHTFLANSEGKIDVAQRVEILISAFKGLTPVGFTIGGLPNVNGLTITKEEANGKIIISTNTLTELAESGIINIPISVEGVAYTKQFSYTKVKTGKDGIDGYTVYLTNENHSFYCESNGSVLEQQSTITTVKAYFGTEERTPTIGTISQVEGLTITKSGATITIKTNGKVLASSGSFNIPITIDNREFIKVFSWSKAFKGVDGKPGESAPHVVVTGEQVFKYAKGSSTPTPSQILLNASKFNVPSTSVGKWQYKYNDEYIDLGVSTNILTVTPSTGTLVDTGSCTFRYIIEDVYDEITVVEVSDGIDGNSGKTFYTWIMYADDEKGSGISNSPTNKEYIGFSYNNTSATESTDPAKYQWSLIKGTDGVPGAKGNDGITYYTWIKYSNSSDGSSMYDTPTTATQYIGIAVNKTTATESTNKADYNWSKFRGDDGLPGKDSYTVILTNENHSFICESDGNITTALSTTCQVLAYKGTSTVTPTIGTITNPTGMTITKSGTVLTIKANAGTTLANNGTVTIPVTVDGITFNKIFSWTKIPKGEKGDPGVATNIPSWITEWDNGKTTINSSTVLTPKLFAGSITSNKPTGVAMGENVFGTTGTYANVNGLVGYKSGTKTYEFNTNGEVLIGNTSGYYISWNGSSLDINAKTLKLGASNVATDSSVDKKVNDATTIVNNKISSIEINMGEVTTKVSNVESLSLKNYNNLLVNSNIKHGTEGWRLNNLVLNTSVRTGVTSSTKPPDRHTILIGDLNDNTAKTRSMDSTKFVVQEGEQISVSYYIMANDYVDYARIYILFTDNTQPIETDNTFMDGYSYTGVSGYSGWVYKTETVTVPTGATRAFVRIGYRSLEKATVDDANRAAFASIMVSRGTEYPTWTSNTEDSYYNHESRIKAAELKISDDKIISTVSQTITNAVNTGIQNLSISAQNLLPFTDFNQDVTSKWPVSRGTMYIGEYSNFGVNSDTDAHIQNQKILRNRITIADLVAEGSTYSWYRAQNITLEKNTTYTLGVWAYTSSNCDRFYIGVYPVLEDGSAGTRVGVSETLTGYTGAFRYLTFTFTTSAESALYSVRFFHYFKSTVTTGNSDVHIYQPMLVKGEKPMDWSPSITDINTNITNSIAPVENHISTVEQHVSTVEQTASKINWLVSSGTSSANMTLTSDAYKVIASNIDLTGKVTFSSLNSSLQGMYNAVDSWGYSSGLSGTTTIDGGKIQTNTITATQIAANTITATQIAANTITSDKLATNVLRVGNIQQAESQSKAYIKLFSNMSLDGSSGAIRLQYNASNYIYVASNTIQGYSGAKGTTPYFQLNAASSSTAFVTPYCTLTLNSSGCTLSTGKLIANGGLSTGAASMSSASVSTITSTNITNSNQIKTNSLGAYSSTILMHASLDGNSKNLGYSGSKFYQLSASYVWGDSGSVSDISAKENIRYIENEENTSKDTMEIIKPNIETRDYNTEDLLTKEDLHSFIADELTLCEFNYIDVDTTKDTDFLRKIGFIANDYAESKVGKYIVGEHEGSYAYNMNNLIFASITALKEEIKQRREFDKYLEETLNELINE